MADKTVHSEECQERQCAARRRALRLTYKRRCDTWIACISSVLSVFLILLVVLLMSFIEFQSRLASSRSDIRPSELVNNLLESYEHTDAKETYRSLAADYAAKLQEANVVAAERGYRIDRICSLFCPALRADDGLSPEQTSEALQSRNRVNQCRFFLAKIPFEGTAAAAGRVLRSPPPMSTDQLRGFEARSQHQLGQTILANFLAAVGSQSDGIAAYGLRLQDQLLRIADANRQLAVDLVPELKRLEHESLFQCKRVEARETRRNNSFCSDDWRGRSVTERFSEHDGADICARSAGQETSQPASCSQCSTDPAAPDTPDPSQKVKASSVVVTGGRIIESAGVAAEEVELNWEFLTHFQLYSDLTFGIAQRLIMSPPDYLAQWLLLFGGALGAMLNILFKHLAPGRRNKWADLVVEPVQGMACAIIVFILFRSGFVVISGQSETNSTATLSSYFVAFIAIGAGMLSEQALLAFRNAASALFGKVEVNGAERWAPGLLAALSHAPTAPTDVRSLAKRIDEKEEVVEKWSRMAEPVPGHMQRRIVVALGVDPATLFTDVRPQRVTPPDGKPTDAGGGGAAPDGGGPDGGAAPGGIED